MGGVLGGSGRFRPGTAALDRGIRFGVGDVSIARVELFWVCRVVFLVSLWFVRSGSLAISRTRRMASMRDRRAGGPSDDADPSLERAAPVHRHAAAAHEIQKWCMNAPRKPRSARVTTPAPTLIKGPTYRARDVTGLARDDARQRAG
jgi:hypothetical protein